ncbi:MAG TPA: phenylalanine--tRNA ligase subunit alpha [Tissierellia bacterium]|jgi:phenylalanyl-tRNA synthetase alpha chain|nr:phenylalanine--tRNA ligase subunit alpha [Tissierellia bacterium]
MKEQLKEIQVTFSQRLREVNEMQALENLRVEYLGKTGVLKEILRGMGKLPKEERPVMGAHANEVRDALEEAIESKRQELKDRQLDAKIAKEWIDITLPGKKIQMGHPHPSTLTTRQIIDVFHSMGFVLEDGPEIDTVANNFDALNSPPDHPSRDLSDTFYFDEVNLLRTHTSPVQVRTMMKQKPPIRMISIGRCFRNDALDATHSPMFTQCEGLVVDEGITMGDLKGTLEQFVKLLFGADTKSVFRPHNFPFTEPSAEVDITCFKCKGAGCRFCSGSGAIEILGCGMVHPQVLEYCGIDSERYTGFAFGMGIERVTMLRYEIDDIRYLFENDQRFSRQFRR